MKIKKYLVSVLVTLSAACIFGAVAAWSISKFHSTDGKGHGFIETGVPEVTQTISGMTQEKVSVLQNLTTTTGKTYKHFTVQKTYEDGVLIRHEIKPGDLSLAKVMFSDMDKATKRQLGVL